MTTQAGSPPRTQLDAARQDLSDATARGEGGRAALAHYADTIDRLVAGLFNEALGDTPRRWSSRSGGTAGVTSASIQTSISSRCSPIRSDASDEGRLGRFLQPLWDLGLVVGHQVRELKDFARIETTDATIRSSCSRCSTRVRSPAIAISSTASPRTFHRAALHAQLLDALLRLTDERHAPFNAHVLSAGARRQSGPRRPARSRRGAGDRPVDRSGAAPAGAVGSRASRRGGRVPAADAVDPASRERRNQNVLSHAMQDKVAGILTYPGALPQARVERLMGDYFRHARGVARWLEWMRRVAPVPVAPNLVKSARRGAVRRCGRGRATSRTPGSSAFQAAIDCGTAVSDDTLSLIQQHADRFTDRPFSSSIPAAGTRGSEFLNHAPACTRRLSQMHDSGLLGRILPEFGAITCRVVRDFYHKYTVDEHTLLAIRTIERLAAPPRRRRRRRASAALRVPPPGPRASRVAGARAAAARCREIARRGSRPESVRLARGIFERLALPADSREVVEFLIANHLQMSMVAFRRDTEDPETVRRFAALVGVEERLKMLCLLTLADVEAVSLETLTPWKEELLWRLYVDTYNQMTLGYGDELIDRSQSDLAQFLGDASRRPAAEEISGFLEGLPRRYLQLFDRETIERHVRLARDIHPDAVHVSLDQKGSAWELTVVTMDKPFLFSNISGVLSSFGMDILRGHAMTSPNGLVLDIFRFTDRERFLELNPDAHDEFVAVLDDVVSGLVE